MNYLINLDTKIFHIKRKMSSYKLFLWPNYMFVNQVVPLKQTEQKLIITMLLPFKNSRRINLCRRPNDTLQQILDRIKLKCNEFYASEGYAVNNISIKVNKIAVPNNSKCVDIFKQNTSNITLEIDSYILQVVYNLPMINAAKLYTPVYKGLMLYPFAIENSYHISLKSCIYKWYKLESKLEVKVGNEIIYIPTENDVGCCLKLVIIPSNEEGKFGPDIELYSSTVKKNIVDKYPFENRLKTKPDNSIRIVSYNILANVYTRTKEAKKDMFPYCPEEFIVSSYRNPLILKELKAYKGDILCLQEVESHVFSKELYPILNKYMGMDGVYLKKSGNKSEGLSCFYSTNKFNLLNQFNIELNDLNTLEVYCGSILKEIQNSTWKTALKKSTVLQVLVLKLISEEKQLILLCNTHLISDPNGDDIRLFLALIELIIVNKIKSSIGNNYPEYKVSVIFCGDFNSTPESGVYDLFNKLLLPEEHSDSKILNDLKKLILFKMNSAYSVETKYSNFTQLFFGLLDYIYFTDDHLKLIQVLPMPPHENVIRHVGLPSILFPSDHISLVADFTIK